MPSMDAALERTTASVRNIGSPYGFLSVCVLPDRWMFPKASKLGLHIVFQIATFGRRTISKTSADFTSLHFETNGSSAAVHLVG